MRQFYLKFRHDFISISKETCLRLAEKALNDTMELEGLVPSLLVFIDLPGLPAVNTSILDQVERMNALQETLSEAENITAKLRIRKALLAKTPRIVNLIRSEKEIQFEFIKKHTDATKDPTLSQRVDGTQIFVILKDHKVQHNIDQVIAVKEYVNLVQ